MWAGGLEQVEVERVDQSGRPEQVAFVAFQVAQDLAGDLGQGLAEVGVHGCFSSGEQVEVGGDGQVQIQREAAAGGHDPLADTAGDRRAGLVGQCRHQVAVGVGH